MKKSSGIEGVAWEDLSVVLAGLSHRSLNQAAQQLGIGQSTASRRLTRLEERLGARLFDRTPDGLLPTPFALQLQPHAQAVERQMADIERLALQQEAKPEGRVRVAIPGGLASEWILKHIDSFYEAYPQVQVDFVIGQAITDLIRREADVALRFVKPTAPEIIVRHVGTIELAPYVHPRLADRPIESLRWMMFDDPDANFLETQWVRQHAKPTHTMAFSLWNALFAAVKIGVGPGLLSPKIAEPAGLQRIGTDLPPVEGRELYLVCHEALRTVPKVDALWRWAVAEADRFFSDSA